MKKYSIYLDDVRTPTEGNWIVVRNYNEFVSKVLELGLDNIELMSLDHDLGETAMKEYFNNVSPNYKLDYDNIEEKTGYDCVKWLVNHFLDGGSDWFLLNKSAKKNQKMSFPLVKVHSANPIGSANMCGYMNNFLMNERQPQTCIRWYVQHTIEE